MNHTALWMLKRLKPLWPELFELKPQDRVYLLTMRVMGTIIEASTKSDPLVFCYCQDGKYSWEQTTHRDDIVRQGEGTERNGDHLEDHPRREGPERQDPVRAELYERR